ncbi:hypothetical protein GCM10027599_24630 [Yimella radicis]
MFCALNGATRTPRRAQARRIPVTSNDFPASELVPVTSSPDMGHESTIGLMPTVHLVRHGRSTWNEQGRIQGQTPHPPLTELGRTQALAAARTLRAAIGAQSAQIVSSDLVRAQQTAQIIGAALDLPVRTDVRLREQGLGEMEGRLARELTAQPAPEGVPVEEVRWGGGESLLDVHRRLSALMAELATAPTEHLVLVTHGDTLRMALAVLAGRTHRQLDWDLAVDNGSVHRCALAPGLSG